MPYATYRFNKIIATATIRFIVTVAIVVYKGSKLVVYRMLTILLTQNIAKDKFAYIPVLDFTSNNDINWCKSTLEIDQQLYLKYHLTDEEIAFIEKMIKPM